MPKRIFPLLGHQTYELTTKTSTERENAARRKFIRIAGALTAASLAIGASVEIFVSNAWGIAIGLAVVGPMLSLLAYAIETSLEAHMDSLMEGKFTALDRSFKAIPAVVKGAVSEDIDGIEGSMQFISSYFQCDSQVDPYNRAPLILKDLQEKTASLVAGSFEVEGEDYYEWLGKRLEGMEASEVKAISHRRVTNYRTDSREKRFLEQNIAFIERKKKITRVFVLSSAALALEKTWTELFTDFVKTNMDVHFVFEDELTPLIMQWLMGGGLSIYDDAEVFYDRSFLESPPLEAEPHRKLIPKATVYFKRHQIFTTMSKTFDAVLDAAVATSLEADGNLERFRNLHSRYVARLRGEGVLETDPRMVKFKALLETLEAGQSDPVPTTENDGTPQPPADDPPDTGTPQE